MEGQEIVTAGLTKRRNSCAYCTRVSRLRLLRPVKMESSLAVDVWAFGAIKLVLFCWTRNDVLILLTMMRQCGDPILIVGLMV